MISDAQDFDQKYNLTFIYSLETTPKSEGFCEISLPKTLRLLGVALPPTLVFATQGMSRDGLALEQNPKTLMFTSDNCQDCLRFVNDS